MANFTVSLEETTEDMRAKDQRSEAGLRGGGCRKAGGRLRGRVEKVLAEGEREGGREGVRRISAAVTVKAEGRR